MNIITRNKKAYHDYFILEHIESGIVLQGSEVKSLRNGRINLKESFVRIINAECFVFGMHISFSKQTNPYFKPNEKRARKLLLHRKQIDKLAGQVSQKGLSIIPLQVYFNKKGKAKILIALAKGKKEYDKRATIKRRELDKEARASLKEYR
ncbi:SsrA-binding protein SmpB [Helicobacter muridarum]|uniref:SsrA-binding protein n=1 Tax=Helicobacter muridarum TaxID=216 RepID=A0A099TXX8_9HELI|nr:SsrA-binding protein SmpB [Helicobacter muridarum]TLE00770.1 SsrA-binding protein SmpB [Helicobacter muridarum]STQ86549.1 SsrA-binding protein [Helicobacter muridarum]